MDSITASHAKQNFGAALARAALAPLGVERHGKLVAGLVPPHWLEQREVLDERRAVRVVQRQVELQRLAAHQRLGIALLCASVAGQRARIHAARLEIDRWERLQLCSADYIARWRGWLALPVRQLVPRMCSEAGGWGTAMRQNSPFGAAGYPSAT